MPRGTLFRSNFSNIKINKLGQVVFRAIDAGPESTFSRRVVRIWLHDPVLRQLSLIVQEGQPIQIASELTATITTLVPFNSPAPMLLNDAGQVLFEADLSSSNWGFFLATPKSIPNTENQVSGPSVEIPFTSETNEGTTTAAGTQKDFVFDLGKLDKLRGELLNEGPHTFRIHAVDEFRNISNVVGFDFELDTVPPLQATLDLNQNSDSEPVGDLQTNLPTVTLVGKTDPTVRVELALVGSTIDNFESYSPGEIVGDGPISKLWRRFGQATNENITISFKSGAFIFGKGLISGIKSGQYGLTWSGGDGEFGAIRYQFDGPVDLGRRSLVSVMMFSDDPQTRTLVSLAFGNSSTTYRTDKHVFLTKDVQTIVFKITEPDVFRNEGTDSYTDVISNVTEIGFTFTSSFGFNQETVIMDDFIFPIVGGSPSAPRTTISDAEGNFSFEDIPLSPGPNDFHVLATDIAGNQSESTTRVVLLAPP